jgi:hypothetical protein
MSTGRESPVRQPPTRRGTRRFISSWRNGCLPLEGSRLVSCRRPEAHGVHAAESTRIAASRLEWPPRVARARRDGRSGSPDSERPRDVGPRCERWRALERDRDAAFEPPFLCDDASPHADQVPARSIVWGGRLVRIGRPIRTRICLSRVLTPPGGEARRRISSSGGVPVVVSRDARLRS